MIESPQAAWERCRPYIHAALQYGDGTHLIEDVEARIEDGTAVFWPGERSAIVTEIIETPRKTILNFWLAGGDLDETTNHMRPVIEAWGKSQGCTASSIVGRPGWVRTLKGEGYGSPLSICLKELR